MYSTWANDEPYHPQEYGIVIQKPTEAHRYESSETWVIILCLGIRIFCQQERSQLRNKEVAMQLLRSRLFEMELQKQQEEIYSQRKDQVGTGSRSEKIRTYNYKDSRCSDHRLGQNFPLQMFLDGNLEEIHSIIIVLNRELHNIDEERLLLLW